MISFSSNFATVIATWTTLYLTRQYFFLLHRCSSMKSIIRCSKGSSGCEKAMLFSPILPWCLFLAQIRHHIQQFLIGSKPYFPFSLLFSLFHLHLASRISFEMFVTLINTSYKISYILMPLFKCNLVEPLGWLYIGSHKFPWFSTVYRLFMSPMIKMCVYKIYIHVYIDITQRLTCTDNKNIYFNKWFVLYRVKWPVKMYKVTSAQ